VILPDGSTLDPNATYTVAANGFLATGGDGFTVFEEGQNVQTVGGDLEALEAYIRSLEQPFAAPDPFTDPEDHNRLGMLQHRRGASVSAPLR
jgi:5'-nucleotidase